MAAKPAHEPARVVDSFGRHSCQPVRARSCSNCNLDHCAELDGGGVHSQCKTVRTHPLPVHRPLLSRDDRAGSCAWLWPRLRRPLRLAAIGQASFCSEADSSGGRPSVLAANTPKAKCISTICASSAPGAKRKCHLGPLPTAIRGIPENICSSGAFLRLNLTRVMNIIGPGPLIAALRT